MCLKPEIIKNGGHVWKKQGRITPQACTCVEPGTMQLCSISEHSIQELQCQWRCYRLQGTGNPLTQCPYISYTAENPYYKGLRVILNIAVGLYACLPMLNVHRQWTCWTHWVNLQLWHYSYGKGETWRWVWITSVSVAPSLLRSLLSFLLPTPKAKYFLPLFCHKLESSSFSHFLSQTGCGWWVKWFVQGAERLVVHVEGTGKSVFNS